MTTGIMIAAGVVLVGLIMEFCAILSAPFGYQDETGFHRGVENRDEVDTRSLGIQK